MRRLVGLQRWRLTEQLRKRRSFLFVCSVRCRLLELVSQFPKAYGLIRLRFEFSLRLPHIVFRDFFEPEYTLFFARRQTIFTSITIIFLNLELFQFLFDT